jgi:hypothetical protein
MEQFGCPHGTTRLILEVFLTLTEVFPCVFLSCKVNDRVNLSKTGHGPQSSTLVVICGFQLFVFCVLFVCKCVLPPGDNPIAVNKYIKAFYMKSDILRIHVITAKAALKFGSEAWVLKKRGTTFRGSTDEIFLIQEEISEI